MTPPLPFSVLLWFSFLLQRKWELCTLLTKPWITCPLTSHLSPNAPGLSHCDLARCHSWYLLNLFCFFFFFEPLQFPLLLPSHRYSSQRWSPNTFLHLIQVCPPIIREAFSEWLIQNAKLFIQSLTVPSVPCSVWLFFIALTIFNIFQHVYLHIFQNINSRRTEIFFFQDHSIFTPVLLPGKSHGWRSLVGCHPWGHQELDMTERPHFHFSLSCIGEGNGNPLQCSCLENPRNGGAWWAAIYGVAQS